MPNIATQSQDAKPILLTVKMVADRYSISPSLVYAYAKNGMIKPIYLPSAYPSKATKHNRKAIRFTLEATRDFAYNIGVVDGFNEEVPSGIH